MSPEYFRLAKFLVVGALGAFIYFVISLIFELMGKPTWLASSLSYLLCIPLIFRAHWTYVFVSNGPYLLTLLKYLTVQCASMVIASIVPYWLSQSVSSSFLIFFVVAAVIIPFNYLANRTWVFNVRSYDLA